MEITITIKTEDIVTHALGSHLEIRIPNGIILNFDYNAVCELRKDIDAILPEIGKVYQEQQLK